MISLLQNKKFKISVIHKNYRCEFLLQASSNIEFKELPTEPKKDDNVLYKNVFSTL